MSFNVQTVIKMTQVYTGDAIVRWINELKKTDSKKIDSKALHKGSESNFFAMPVN